MHAARPVRRVGPDGQLIQNLVVEVTQRTAPSSSTRRSNGSGTEASSQSTPSPTSSSEAEVYALIFDLETARPIYFVRKSVLSEDRLRRQRDFATSGGRTTSLRAVYFGGPPGGEPFAILHRDS